MNSIILPLVQVVWTIWIRLVWLIESRHLCSCTNIFELYNVAFITILRNTWCILIKLFYHLRKYLQKHWDKPWNVQQFSFQTICSLRKSEGPELNYFIAEDRRKRDSTLNLSFNLVPTPEFNIILVSSHLLIFENTRLQLILWFCLN